jgi:hypothetical protein
MWLSASAGSSSRRLVAFNAEGAENAEGVFGPQSRRVTETVDASTVLTAAPLSDPVTLWPLGFVDFGSSW